MSDSKNGKMKLSSTPTRMMSSTNADAAPAADVISTVGGTVPQEAPPKSNVVLNALVLLIVGAALGNVLLAGKLKNLGKINYDAFKKASATGEAGAAQRNAHKYSSGDKNSNSNWSNKSTTSGFEKASVKLPEVPALLVPHMKQLELEASIENLHSEPIKGAFRKLAMAYHPDRIPATDARRKEFEGKFKDVSESYKFLKRYMIKSKKK